jgi:hypothetical protein
LTSKSYKRVFHHYQKCEEFVGNMWKSVPPAMREGMVQASRNLMIDCKAFEAAMCRAVDEWPNSCEAALTATVINHQAWMGHAGCAINHDAPEDLTRMAWRSLNEDQQALANAAADRAIEYWEIKYAEHTNDGSYTQLVLPLHGASVWQPASSA